jgi:hypothetical protein
MNVFYVVRGTLPGGGWKAALLPRGLFGTVPATAGASSADGVCQLSRSLTSVLYDGGLLEGDNMVLGLLAALLFSGASPASPSGPNGGNAQMGCRRPFL